MRVMRRRDILALEFVACLRMKLLLTLALESAWCFGIFFAAGLRFPLDPAFLKILARFGLRMHYLTPNAIVQLSKFFWAVKTIEGPVNVDAFCRLYEMHPQTRKVSFDEDLQVFSAQSGCCSFHPRRFNRTQGIDKMELSYCQKNKWEDDWEQYWFYAKIGFPSDSSSGGGGLLSLCREG